MLVQGWEQLGADPSAPMTSVSERLQTAGCVCWDPAVVPVLTLESTLLLRALDEGHALRSHVAQET